MKEPKRIINVHQELQRFREGRRQMVEQVIKPREERVREMVSDEEWWSLYWPYDRLHLGS